MTLSPVDAAFAADVAAGQGKIDSLDALLEAGGGSIADPDTALILSNTIADIIGPPAKDGEKTTIGLEVGTKAVDTMESIVDALSSMDVASPDEILPTISAVVETVGQIMNVMLDGGGGGDGAAKNSTTEVDPCSLIPAVDKENADKPGVVEYDTDIGDDPSMQVNPDPSKQRCLGVSRATGTAGRAIITNSYSDWT